MPAEANSFDPRVLLWLLTFVIQIVQAVWLYREKQIDKTDERLSSMSKQIADLEKKTGEIEAAAESAPTHADLEKVYRSINDVAGTVNQIVGENRAQTAMLNQLLGKAIGGHHG